MSELTEILYSKGNENSFYYTFSTLAQIISGIFAVIGTITLFRLEKLEKVKNENVANLITFHSSDNNEPFLEDNDVILINENYTSESIVEIVEISLKSSRSENMSQDKKKKIKKNLEIVRGIFQQIEHIQLGLKKFTMVTIYLVIWCILSLSLAKFIIDSKCWFTSHVAITLVLSYYFLNCFTKQYYLTFGVKINYFDFNLLR